MWIFCCGMRRSGSTLQYQIALELATRKASGVGLGYALPGKFGLLQETYKDDSRIKVVKTHLFVPEAKQLLESGMAKAIYSYRDIRDVIASLMNMQGIKFDKIADLGMIYLLLKEHELWTNCGDVYVSRYENMKMDLPGEVSRIASYLHFDLEEKEAWEIAEKYSLNRQKERISQFRDEQMQETTAGMKRDPATLMHSNHILSGDQGRWLNMLSRYEIAVVEHIARYWMREHDYPFSQNWFVRKSSGVWFHLGGKLQELVRRRNKKAGDR